MYFLYLGRSFYCGHYGAGCSTASIKIDRYILFKKIIDKPPGFVVYFTIGRVYALPFEGSFQPKQTAKAGGII